MPSANGATRTKYLLSSRVKSGRTGGGDDFKPADDLAKQKADGQYLEYWEALLNPGAAATSDSYAVLEKREAIAPNAVSAEATFANGKWSVTFSRKLQAGPPYHDIEAGKPYTVGFAVHAGHTAGRFHYVSYEYTVAVDSGSADFVAGK
jgi:cytochrome c-type protein NapC